MKTQPRTVLILSLILILAILGISACASVASAQRTGGMEAQVNTAVAATLIQQAVETKVAEQSAAEQSSVAMAAQPAEQQAQATQPPTPTPVPTQPPPPTAAPTQTAQATVETSSAAAPGPTILADQNTNCRAGPGTGYKVLTYFTEGSESTVEGRDSTKDWWYIVSPADPDENCWVWEGSTTVVGDTSQVPVVAAPASPSYKVSDWYDDCYIYKGYGCVYFPSASCQKTVVWNGYVICVQSKPVCNANSWWSCNIYGYCTCQPVCKPPWKQSNCPPLTSVNFKNYCNNYPQCCDEETGTN